MEAPEVKIEGLRPGEWPKGMNGGGKPERKGHRKSREGLQYFKVGSVADRLRDI